ncbi:outer dynein arm intermediate chain subunit-like protein [Skeletonema marinoi]|uniref:Outer dynein arm intermediate chain subunit-like protein n=1 Tax=Skeletonema marinoi TaxID=267567 RepID=A0AAD8YD07_9STRA|nr:outer dynein arm intermediate chain subunit-like protein [Skeletonema marinoi]
MVLRPSKSVPTPKQNKAIRSPSNGKPSSSGVPTSPVVIKSRRKDKDPTAASKSPQPKTHKRRPNSAASSKTPKRSSASCSDALDEPLRRVIKPENQLELTEKELEEDVTRILTGDDPNLPQNVCRFSFKDKCYKPDPPGQGDNMAVHFSLEGCSMHVNSDECKKLMTEQEAAVSIIPDVHDGESSDSDGRAVAAAVEGKADPATSSVLSSTDDGTKAKNQFNFSERASQTFNNPLKSRAINTEPPLVTQYQDDVSQWKIYDNYKADFLINQKMMENQGTEDKLASMMLDYKEPSSPSPRSSSGEQDSLDTIHSETMANTLKIMERLVNQNAQDEVFQDFKYYEDEGDQFREHGEGVVMPLWTFVTSRTNKKQVTSLCWNPRYNDLFAVGYGSYDYMRQSSGMVCCFSLKNTSYPEYIISVESGVMCLDFHPRHPSLLAVGCYDGTVLVYDIKNRSNTPIYSSCLRSGKHSDPVWQVCWRHSNGFNFYSISSDGKVANWTMSKNELKMEPFMFLKLTSPADNNKEDSSSILEPALSGLAGGSAFDFNSKLDNLFLVGTEEGNIHACSKAYSGQYMKSYDGHHMGVHAIQWNPFHEDIFISCSADWTVKIWDHNSSQCLLHFDLGDDVGDVCWSPYSSTVFAAVTTDGKVHVFDLAQNKREPMCSQKVDKRALTKAAFNRKEFVLIVGDDIGRVISLKLSPNLRRSHDDGGEEGVLDDEMTQIQRDIMVKLIASI